MTDLSGCDTIGLGHRLASPLHFCPGGKLNCIIGSLALPSSSEGVGRRQRSFGFCHVGSVDAALRHGHIGIFVAVASQCALFPKFERFSLVADEFATSFADLLLLSTMSGICTWLQRRPMEKWRARCCSRDRCNRVEACLVALLEKGPWRLTVAGVLGANTFVSKALLVPKFLVNPLPLIPFRFEPCRRCCCVAAPNI